MNLGSMVCLNSLYVLEILQGTILKRNKPTSNNFDTLKTNNIY